jgi:hypothetical protein
MEIILVIKAFFIFSSRYTMTKVLIHLDVYVWVELKIKIKNYTV